MENELFEHAPVPKAYFTMALPVVMGMVVNLVYNIVDTFLLPEHRMHSWGPVYPYVHRSLP